MILKCECKHEYQDEKLGAGNRQHNTKRDGGYRCTVCGKEREAKKKEVAEKKSE